jgi:hypothetical protein
LFGLPALANSKFCRGDGVLFKISGEERRRRREDY